MVVAIVVALCINRKLAEPHMEQERAGTRGDLFSQTRYTPLQPSLSLWPYHELKQAFKRPSDIEMVCKVKH